MDRKSILIFGVGPLQQSIIERCKSKGLYTVGIDPSEDATCRNIVDAFEIVGGNDFEKTIEVAKKYNVSGIITAATDKPLVMMSQVANALNFPFYSVDTASISTDKFLMKEVFLKSSIPCAQGRVVSKPQEVNGMEFPLILKPRDNSGSRGVIFCKDYVEVERAFSEVEQHTKKDSILVEEYIEGKEYSIESLHYKGKTYVIQFTEKITTAFPYNVELGHSQPAELSENDQTKIREVIAKMASALNFENCASHTELKINPKGIKIIETSPRLGGDFISSTLVPLSTGVNMEDILIDIATGVDLQNNCFVHKYSKSSGITYFVLPEGEIRSIADIEKIKHIEGLYSYSFELNKGDIINRITSSLNRYGYAIFQAHDRAELFHKIKDAEEIIRQNVTIQMKKNINDGTK